ncbi:MAG TPA: MarR family transcriptional regulator [bacterium]|nr:MarR family transcriptional regulator [bacterium]
MMKELCKLKEMFRAIYAFEVVLKKDFNISINEALTLCTLDKEHRNSGELAHELGISLSRMSRVLSTLEGKKLIERTLGIDDKRKMIFSLSPIGKKKITDLRHRKPSFPDLC